MSLWELLLYMIVFIVIGGVGYWAIQKLASVFGMPAQVVTVIQVVFVLFAVAILLGVFFGGVEAPRLR